MINNIMCHFVGEEENKSRLAKIYQSKVNNITNNQEYN